MQIWERDVHMDLLREYIKEQNLLNAQNSNKRKYK